MQGEIIFGKFLLAVFLCKYTAIVRQSEFFIFDADVNLKKNCFILIHIVKIQITNVLVLNTIHIGQISARKHSSPSIMNLTTGGPR